MDRFSKQHLTSALYHCDRDCIWSVVLKISRCVGNDVCIISRPLDLPPDYIWLDDVLVHLRALIRAYHDVTSTFPQEGRAWLIASRQQQAVGHCHLDRISWKQPVIGELLGKMQSEDTLIVSQLSRLGRSMRG